ncbi:hypothetical protein [Gordonia terrae]|uniref:hypothetical protein n=1 Tax=Gordonia terrae TaxID=2055 RepID=UPI003F6A739A
MAAEADSLLELSAAAADLLAAEQRLLVLGGSCTVAVGLCAAMALAGERPRSALSSGPFVVHLDVDVLDFLDAPIAENVNGRNSGPTIAILEQALVTLLHDPDCRGMSIGQLDPAHASADPTAVPRLVSALVSALTST